MRVISETWRGEVEMDLVDALTPTVVLEADGQVERAADSAALALRVIGKILAEMVERRMLTVEEAGDLIGETLKEAEG